MSKAKMKMINLPPAPEPTRSHHVLMDNGGNPIHDYTVHDTREKYESRHPDMWSIEEIATLEQLWSRGIKLSEIAKAVGRSEASCKIKAYKMGLHKWKEAEQ